MSLPDERFVNQASHIMLQDIVIDGSATLGT
ncbi:hypothetical protein BDE27_2300 [Xenorhabdus ehlersii]|uniref:2,3-dihydro-2,3-dihydroxybenzoate dehydrogenase n=1 Tax=Xenorhabdus ehlersii TaxID=290111 RepID=A0A2D0ITW4_9GAMM|nr:2,3-dihydro-2,3-dihydroxybenzoate dehydrogenase [Xenorhabdus sp. TS4]MBC8948789.1 2,3-dihydro-2,3-dihydroxybenzoate dehydrogenase [Xenorhabdus sp. TS4]PHM25305.1 2,3-dihydro-2,3-dihydroxybenzoate dehydrogenase [Xenorhabdus ehlersii]PHM26882.1 2,3-dihydro-2,3-dihydroxybenzoate dehydrogenase [Xenorhabdus ehlersii]RKE90436.1 hypothetical protein BDE27_2300 [Xenorhabdus ehlersii]